MPLVPKGRGLVITHASATPAAGRLVLVVGSGRSGTSAMTGLLKHLGLHVPQPEIGAREHNPRGYFEPRWVVRFHRRLLGSAGVSFNDARPASFELAERVGGRAKARAELSTWLRQELAGAPEIIVKDPRNAWFVPLWQQCARQAGLIPCSLTMLRHPVEVVASKDANARNAFHYAIGPRLRGTAQPRYTQSWAVANWVNMALFTELATRGSARAFVRFPDLLADWRAAVGRVAGALDLSLRHGLPPERAAAADAFLDASLRRSSGDWGDVDVPPWLRDLAEDVSRALDRLAGDEGEDPRVLPVLDELRAAYTDRYAQAEALAQSSVLMARRRRRRAAERRGR